MLTKIELQTMVPAMFADSPSERVSRRYTFLPTTEIVDILEDEGWHPWKASQVRGKTEESVRTAKHLVRFRHSDLLLDEDVKKGDLFPEILLINSHDGWSSYQLRAGMFRLVCGNGMVISEEEFGTIRICHRGFEEEEVREASQMFTENAVNLNQCVNEWRTMRLNDASKMSFANQAARLRFENPGSDIVENLLVSHRPEDHDSSLWSVFNRVQENLLQGGFLNNETGRRVRPITAIKKNVSINSGLWSIASKYNRSLN